MIIFFLFLLHFMLRLELASCLSTEDVETTTQDGPIKVAKGNPELLKSYVQ